MSSFDEYHPDVMFQVSILQQSQHLWHQLAMFFRDELLSWSWRRPLGLNLGPATSGSSMNPADFKHKVTTNVDHVISRITKIAPQSLSEEVTSISNIPSNVMLKYIFLVVMNSRYTGPIHILVNLRLNHHVYLM